MHSGRRPRSASSHSRARAPCPPQVYFLQMAIVFVGHGSVLDWAHFINFRVAQAIGVSRCLFLVTPVGHVRAMRALNCAPHVHRPRALRSTLPCRLSAR
jgi:hypothetical protein